MNLALVWEIYFGLYLSTPASISDFNVTGITRTEDQTFIEHLLWYSYFKISSTLYGIVYVLLFNRKQFKVQLDLRGFFNYVNLNCLIVADIESDDM